MHKTPVKKSAARKNHNGSIAKLALLRKLKNNAKYVVAKSLIKARHETAPVRYYLKANPAKTAGFTLIAGLVGGFCAKFLIDAYRDR